VPFFFIYNPSLLWRGPLWMIFISFVTAVFGCMAIGSAVEGYLLRRTNLLERVILFAAGLFLISQGLRESAIGLAVFMVVLGIQSVLIKRAEKKALTAVSNP